KIDDGASGLFRRLPMTPGESLVGGEEGEVNPLEALRLDALDKGGFVAERLELPQRFVVVKQFHVDGGKVQLLERILQLTTFKSGRADDRDAKVIWAHQIQAISGCDAEGYGSGETGRRRNANESRAPTPASK